MEALSRTVYIVTMEMDPSHEDELNRWYAEEHLPALLAVPGYRSARRYVAVEGEPKYMAFWEIDSIEAFRSQERQVAINTPWSDRLKPHRQSQLAIYEQVFPTEGVRRGPAWGDGRTEEGGLMVIRIDVAPEDEADFNAWYDEEHLPALCAVPGVIAARRFRALEGEPKYMAVYSLVGPEVQSSAPWKQAIDTPWSARVRQTFLTRWRTVYRPLGPRIEAPTPTPDARSVGR
jgi:antibiotic biosynthesis monooxygenase (ABM) superfamily enzyme